MKKIIRKYIEKFQKGNNLTSYIRVVMLFLVFLLLEPFLVSFFNEHLNGIKFHYTDLIFILTFILLAYYAVVFMLKLLRFYRPNDNLFIASGLITFVFFYYKFELSPHTTDLLVTGDKSYINILIMLIIFPIFQVFLKVSGDLLRFFEVLHRTGNKATSLIDYDDHPEMDLFNRKSFAVKIANELRRIKDKKSISIGILGQWGEGKTTVLKYIEDDVGDEFIVLKFNPWKSSSPKLIKDDFFDLLKDKLSYYDGRLSSQIEEYLKVISSNISNGLFSYLPNFNKDQESIFKEVNKSISDLSKRLLIFIDDLDRLDKREVKETIKLVRNYANFSNCTFIVAYDKNMIINSLGYNEEFETTSYLDKIFQVEITLPKASNIILADELKCRLINHFQEFESEITNFVSKESNYTVGDQFTGKISIDTHIIGGILKNLRDIKRLCNSLVFSLKKDSNSGRGIEGEVDFIEYLFLEVIKLKSVSVYNKLKVKSLLESKSGVIKFNEKEFDNTYKDAKSIDSLNKEQIKKLLKNLFNDNKTYTLRKSITVPSFYDYFFLADGNFSVVELIKLRQKSKEENNSRPIINFLKLKLEEQKNIEIINEIKIIFEAIHFFDNESDFKNIIDSIFYLHTNGVDMYSKIVSLLSEDKVRIIVESKTLENFENANIIVEELLDKYSENIEIAYLLHSIIRTRLSTQNDTFVISLDELKARALNYFKVHGFKKKVIDKYTLSYFGACLSGIDSISKKLIVSSEAIEYFKENKDKYPYKYSDLKTRVGSSTNGPLFALNWLLKEVFGSWDEFYSFIDSKDDVNKDFLDFLENFKRNNFDTVAYKDGKYRPY